LKNISAIYFDGDKERYYVKRFLIENENKEEVFITEHENSQLEIVSTDWKPMAEVIFSKLRGKDQKENIEVNLEEFITIKGIKALGNQLTSDKIKQINLLDSLPYDAPEEIHADDIEVVDEETVTLNEVEESKKENSSKPLLGNDTAGDVDIDDEGQITLF